MRLRSAFTAAFLLLLLTGLSLRYAVAPVQGQSGPVFTNFEGSQTSPIRLSPDGTRLFAVNTANASLSVFDVTTPSSPTLIREIPVGIEPVSVNARTNDEAWVVNQVSDSVSIVSVSRGIVVATLAVPDEPMDVVFAGANQAYISVAGSNAVAVYNATTRDPIRTLPLFGTSPRALAVSPDGTLVYAAFALSGNKTTLVPEGEAPPPPPPTNPSLPPAPQVAKIVAADDPAWSSIITYQMPDYDVAVIATGALPRVAGYYSGVGTINLGLGVNPVSGDIFVANSDARNLVQFEPNLRGHFVDNRITRIAKATAQVTPFDLNPGINYATLPNPAARATALAQPTAVTFDPGGEFMYVAAFGTDRVARVDVNGNVLSFVEVGPPSGSGSNIDPRTKRGPRGLALNAAGHTLYALNRISNTISVIDTVNQSVSRELWVGTDPTPLALRVGRGFLYDAKLSGNGTGSCASCHIDGDMDLIAWDLGNPGGDMVSFDQGSLHFEFHPMKGPMTTQTLKGLSKTSPFHWRGDKPTFVDFNPAFDGLLGGSQLSSGDMLAFTGFVNTIVYPPNPNLNLDRSMPATIRNGNPANGQVIFNTVAETRPGPVTCEACHKTDPGPGTNRIIIDSPLAPQPLKTPHLRNAYRKIGFNRFFPTSIDGFGMDHDGHVSTFLDFMSAAIFAGYSGAQKTDLSAYMMAFDTGTAPAVGHAFTLSPATAANAQLQTDWTTLQQQSRLRNNDVTVRGTINGVIRAFTYRPFNDDYSLDAIPSVTLTRAQLQSFVEHGDTLTVMGVPPREGIAQSTAISLTDAAAITNRRGVSRGH